VQEGLRQEQEAQVRQKAEVNQGEQVDMRISQKLPLLLLPVLLTGILALSAAPASAAAECASCSPWWGITAGARPTNLQAGRARDAVAQLTVTGTGGEFTIYEPYHFQDSEYHAGFHDFPFGASAETVRTGLEELLPGDELHVTGGPHAPGEPGPHVYEITFTGQAFCLGIDGSGGFAEAFGPPGSKNLEGGGEVTLTTLAPGLSAADGQIVVDAQNRGDASTSGPVTITSHLPAGLEPVAIEAVSGATAYDQRGFVECSLHTLTCKYEGEYVQHRNGGGEALVPKQLPPYEQIEVRISTELQPGAASGEQVTATVSGGSAARAASASHTIQVGGPAKFGVEDYQLIPETAGGAPDTQAGSHPFQLTNITTFSSALPDANGLPESQAQAKDVIAELPAGFIGNPTPFAQCTDAQFATKPKPENGALERFINDCPEQSAIGVATVTYKEPIAGFGSSTVPIFNMVPRAGEPARFGFKPAGLFPAFLDASVRTGGDYGVTISSSDITQLAGLLSVKLTFWGVPGDARHDGQRGWNCLQGEGACSPSGQAVPPPFLVMPSACEPFASTINADSWASPLRGAESAEAQSYSLAEMIDGCDRLPFAPSLSVAPDVPSTSSPTGLTVDVHVPQAAALNPEGVAESSVKGLSVTLPAGVALNPAGADGLQACSLLTGKSQVQESQEEKGELEGIDVETGQPANCPNASKVATLKVTTPLLPNPLNGFVYLATPAPNGEPGMNPFNSLIALYLVAKDPVSGTLVKLPLKVTADPVTGQLTATQAIPQLPFEDAELHFFGGERAPLATPPHCGAYTTAATFEPWSGNEPASFSTPPFQITTGPNGTPCPGGALPFAPTLAAGTTNINAGSFSPLATTITREDGQQDIQTVQLHYPAGLSGILSAVKLCPEAQANAGSCGPESEIGSTIVSVGLGSDPFSVTGGQVFLTEKYAGAPFGLSIVNPAVAGPFNLGKVIVRAKVEVDPTTAALTVTTDSSGPYAIPHILDGIPLQIKHVSVTITGVGANNKFTFNPTNCNKLAITGSIASAEGASSPVSVPFQATNCKALAFEPKFTVSTSGKTSIEKGASLTAKVTEPAGSLGTQANIAKVKVELPKFLPSRLTTLQKACTTKQFNENPANCPKESKIGYAVVNTPLLPVPLEGPAIFVSHGDEAFPSLTLVLQGDNVTIDLVGATLIRNGVTSTTFKTVPDAPFSSFDLTLPEGKFSALAANENLCKLTTSKTVTKKVKVRQHGKLRTVTRKVKEQVSSSLKMPNEFVAQNGAEIKQTTPISVTGCAKAKPAKKHKGKSKRKGKKKK
jgi:hypothetical protein